MSEYTREEILKMIEDVGGPENLDLSGKDLSGIDLSAEAIAKELERYQKQHFGQIPAWFESNTQGINLQNANLLGARLQGANLIKANLQQTDLRGANLQQSDLRLANLHKANLERASLQEAMLYRANLQEAVLVHVNLQEAWVVDVNLQEAKLWRGKLQEAHLGGAKLLRAHLVQANLRRASLAEANLEEADLGAADLQEADLAAASLVGTKLESANLREAHLWAANLQGAYLRCSNLQQAKLQKAHLERVDMYDVETLAGAYFHGAFLEHTRLQKEHLGRGVGEEADKEYYEAKEAYLLLKNNFNQIGRYDDASWAYVKERQMEKMTHWPLSYARKWYGESELPKEYGTWSRRVDLLRFYLRHLRLFITDWITELLCLYGESPSRVVACAVALAFLIFPLLYALFGGVVSTDGSPVTWSEYLRLSLASFATMELAGVQTQGIAVQFLGTLEALTGISLLALLMFTLGKRISRS